MQIWPVPILGGGREFKPWRSARAAYELARDKWVQIVWSEASFKDYIVNPMARVPGTKMAFGGIKNEKEIGDLWGYLKQFKADGKK